jgi:hypothetical protein
MNMSRNRLPLLVALLLASSAVLFAIGTAIERSQRATHHDEAALSSAAKSGGETSSEKKATGEAAGASASTETHSEKIAGIDPESWPLVGLAIAVSLLIAAGVYWRRGRWLVVAIVLGLLFAAADTRELVHQIQESRTTVAVIAGVLIALHLLVAVTASAARRVRGARGT